ncbi:MAG: DUF1554 domain-containing protein [Thermomicrobiales bacterium]
MDANRFDILSRHLGLRGTRRGASALGALLVVALALPETGGAQVQAELCVKPGQGCKKKQGKHRKKLRCCGKARCRKGRCRCKPGFQSCQGKCISKAECCGGCPAGQTCSNGQCTGCGPCQPGETCVNDQCVGCGQGGDCTVFATSTLHNGNLGGLAGADAICQQRAGEARLSGTYLAWLSSTTESPATRFIQNPGRYTRTDGLPIAANWAALVSGTIAVPIDRSETGQLVRSNREVWTNTGTDGLPYFTDPSQTCDDWMTSGMTKARVGETDEVDGEWTTSHEDTCDFSWRLYCVQQN